MARYITLPEAWRMRAAFFLCVVILFGCCLVQQSAKAQTGRTQKHIPSAGHNHRAPDPLSYGEKTSIVMPDLTLTNQDNRPVKLYTDVMKGKLVILNFFYTTCEGICPTSGLWLSKLQDKLGDRMGREVVILSITIDPEKDTPAKLRSWGRYWKRRSGWTLLTSTSTKLRELMKEFRPYPSKGVHSPIIFVGDGNENPMNWVALDILSEDSFLLNYLEVNGKGGSH